MTAAPTVEVLVSTMNRVDCGFLEDMFLQTPALVVNQNGSESEQTIWVGGHIARIVCSDAIGLSRSRNLALSHARGDICVLADDDVVYEPGYEETIRAAYRDYPDADIIAFQVERTGSMRSKRFRGRPQWETYLSSMKISSVEITFRRASVLGSGLFFNVLLGAGAEFYVGEESVFLFDALRRGLKVLYVPEKIGAVCTDTSSWFSGYDDGYFRSLGAAYLNMSRALWPLLALQYIVRKWGLYHTRSSAMRAMREMARGVSLYRRRLSSLDDCGTR